ncbi:hypothetical protein TH25_23455 [Thalassospira profundimaris]|uniref:CREG-like beta-barrel domain-containing protein n=1 Tax=Thalassospira profundimaris TaxID=502049 RepID=A0A367WKG3_9PROT|nr:pyridoxamine 5'-phosphate oxidase family protein [Thalassospira profundimaris]RCK41945.1 hypothetical protein TH25_23455 [Thalassospira profundimaris]
MEQDPVAPANDAASLRRLMRRAPEATLATLAHDHSQVANGWPVTSMVQPVIDMDGTPVMLISELADHTRHIQNNPRVSLLFRPFSSWDTRDEASETGRDKPVTDTQRLTVFGTARKMEDHRIKRRYLAIQPAAALYAGFADFAFYRIDIEAAYWVGGFGKQRRLRGDQLRCPVADSLIANHDTLIDMLQGKQPELTGQIVPLHGPENCDCETNWKPVTIDCDGAHFACNDTILRIEFPHTIFSVEDAQNILVKMGQKKNEIQT